MHIPFPPLDLLPHEFFALPDGTRLRYAQFSPSSPPRGTILILPGRREFIEKKYIEVGKPLCDRGYRVIIMEPRNHGLSSRVLSDDKKQRDHMRNFSLFIDDLRAFYKDVVKPNLTSPLIVHAHSLGAHVLLRWLSEDHPPIAGAFVTAPMLALFGMAAQKAAYGLSWASVRLLNHETHYAPTQHDFNNEDIVFYNNPLTQDEQNFRIVQNYFAAHPNLLVGGTTWGWVLAALRSMDVTHNWPYLARIDVPVLALIGEHDFVTPSGEIMPYLNQIPNSRTHTLTGARHDIMNETDSIRAEAWQQIDEFLKKISTKS
jgi:lysophospholipase